MMILSITTVITTALWSILALIEVFLVEIGPEFARIGVQKASQPVFEGREAVGLPGTCDNCTYRNHETRSEARQ